MIWDTIKAVTRGICILIICVNQEGRRKDLEDQINELEKEFIRIGDSKINKELQALRQKLEMYESEKIQRSLMYLRRDFLNIVIEILKC